MQLAIVLLTCVLGQLRADYNGDGIVNFKDYTIVSQRGDFKAIQYVIQDWLCEDDMSFKYAQLDGKEDTYIEIPDSSNINFGTNDGSISFWINLLAIGGTPQIIDWGDFLVLLRFSSGANCIEVLDMIDSSNVIARSAVNSIQTSSQWQHIAIVFDRSGNSVVYVNGAVSGSGMTCNASNWSGGTEKYILPQIACGINDIRIYSKVLTGLEVASIYNDGTGSLCNDDAVFVMSLNGDYVDSVGGLVGTPFGGISFVNGGVPFHAIDLNPDTFEDIIIPIEDTGKNVQFRFRSAGGSFEVRNMKIKAHAVSEL